jgi:hypothetical protein
MVKLTQSSEKIVRAQSGITGLGDRSISRGLGYWLHFLDYGPMMVCFFHQKLI